MAINVSQAFHRTSANPVDESMALTKAQMLTINDNLMPAYYFTICQDDGKIYLYDKSATASATTGKFKEFEGGGGSVTVDDEMSSTSTNPVENKTIYSALGGKADLVDGKVPASQLPSYVDDVLEYEDLSAFPETGESGKIYVALDTAYEYRWTGSVYARLNEGVVLGETSSTAYRGDRGKIAYDDSRINKAAIGNLADLDTSAKSDLVSAINEALASSDGGVIEGYRLRIPGTTVTNMEDFAYWINQNQSAYNFIGTGLSSRVGVAYWCVLKFSNNPEYAYGYSSVPIDLKVTSGGISIKTHDSSGVGGVINSVPQFATMAPYISGTNIDLTINNWQTWTVDTGYTNAGAMYTGDSIVYYSGAVTVNTSEVGSATVVKIVGAEGDYAFWKDIQRTMMITPVSNKIYIDIPSTSLWRYNGSDYELLVDEMPQHDIADVITPLPTTRSRYPKYSEEEQIVGEWIDGKPIYQCVIPLPEGANDIPANTWTYIKSVVIPMDKMIKGYIVSADNERPSDINYFTLRYHTQTNAIEVLHSRSVLINVPIGSLIILQYTKTTD